MADLKRRSIRRGVAVAVLAGGLALGALTFVGSAHVAAQGIPHKTCVDPLQGTTAAAKPGDTIVCTVSIGGVVLMGSAFQVQPSNSGLPSTVSGAFIPASGCTGASGGTIPFNYTTTATDNGQLGTTGGICIFTITAGNLGIGDNVIGTESIHIPVDTAAGSTLTQQAKECIQSNCGQFTPMGVAGPASCVNGTPNPLPIGGCLPSAPGGTPTPSGGTPTPSNSHTPRPTESGGGGNGGGDNGGGQTGGGGATGGVKSLANTSAPVHPFPTAPVLLAGIGLALAGSGLFGLRRLRRRRQENS